VDPKIGAAAQQKRRPPDPRIKGGFGRRFSHRSFDCEPSVRAQDRWDVSLNHVPSTR
jgi:hypothetical protein